MNGGEDLPHQDECQTNGNNGSNNTQNNAHDINNNRTFFGSLNPDLQFSSEIVVAIDKSGPTIIIINE